jgi:hypothetical protein
MVPDPPVENGNDLRLTPVVRRTRPRLDLSGEEPIDVEHRTIIAWRSFDVTDPASTSAGTRPRRGLVRRKYAGWGPGQLDQEL